MGTLRDRGKQAGGMRRGNLLFQRKSGQRNLPFALSINSPSMAGATDGKPGW